mmetsp:Transcript_22625/g.61256  ORF Transcript_22625/g.61256 Transcript_22625/m.61256 type:complete len:213 (+) Transcript_22625:1662-2300(+)
MRRTCPAMRPVRPDPSTDGLVHSMPARRPQPRALHAYPRSSSNLAAMCCHIVLWQLNEPPMPHSMFLTVTYHVLVACTHRASMTNALSPGRRRAHSCIMAHDVRHVRVSASRSAVAASARVVVRPPSVSSRRRSRDPRVRRRRSSLLRALASVEGGQSSTVSVAFRERSWSKKRRNSTILVPSESSLREELKTEEICSLGRSMRDFFYLNPS